MKRIAVINAVGLTTNIINDNATFLKKWQKEKSVAVIKPQLPAVTCTMQATYLTGKTPSEHGIVGNGWYFDEECEIKFWRQSNKLIQAKKIWEYLKEENPDFTCANICWWYNMYSSVDYSVTPRPQYHADGLKLPDCYTQPSSLRDELQQELGTFPLFEFWGPRTSVKSSQWIADAALYIEKKFHPTLTLIYLPHLDYNFQRLGNDTLKTANDIKEIDEVCEKLIKYYEKNDVEVIVLSEYGITDVNNPIHLNRILRKNNLLAIREEAGLELLDAGASEAFTVADHQVAHVYVKNKNHTEEIKNLLSKVDGIDLLLSTADAKENYGLNHNRSGDIICIANSNSWFTYYYWLDDSKAPDFARTVDIHRKPGYDPVELFMNPDIKVPLLKVGTTLIKKKIGFRYLMDVIPLNADLVKGSHGNIPGSKSNWPLIIANEKTLKGVTEFKATEIFSVLRNAVTRND